MFGPTLYVPVLPGTNDMSSFKFNGVRDWSPYLGRCLSDCVWVWPVIFELRSWAHTECLHKTNTHTTKLSVVFLCHFGVCKFRFAYTLRVKCPHSLWGNIIFPYELKMIKKIRQIRLRSQSNVVHSFLWRLGHRRLKHILKQWKYFTHLRCTRILYCIKLYKLSNKTLCVCVCPGIPYIVGTKCPHNDSNNSTFWSWKAYKSQGYTLFVWGFRFRIRG